MTHGLCEASAQVRSRAPVWRALACWSVLMLAPASATAKPAGERFFEEKIRPVLSQHCYRCHSAQARKPGGRLLLDSRAALLAGGQSGPALVPGKPGESLLLQAMRHKGDLEMPPGKKLPDQVIADFSRWIEMGAADPRVAQVVRARPAAANATGGNFWAFVAPRRHDPPAVGDASWPQTWVDRFLLAALEKRGLRPARQADRSTLLRRVTIDLTGLPPTPEELSAFLEDQRPDAFARTVDRLLASPGFGERWGRHWLDVARYADSTGKGDNLTYHEAWRYRDYVIGSFNADKPFDLFVREQVAGDLLGAPTQQRRDENLIATGFLVVGPKVLADRDVEQRKMDVVDDQVDTIGRAFLGLTLGCARCHDHKFDPIPTADYYALAGILASTRTLEGNKLNNPAVTGWSLRPLGDDGEKLLAAHREVDGKIQKIRQSLEQLQKDSGNGDSGKQIRELTAAQKKLLASVPPCPPLALAVRDEATPENLRVNIRGNPHMLGVRVPRGFLRVLDGVPAGRIPADRSGRLELADWLSHCRNPLTARVLVNRVWLHLFGEGLVRSVDNFGVQGEKPSHPELLDELAVRFVEEGWSVKRLIRTIVLSRAYQMACTHDPVAARLDADNRLLWRANRRRLEAEVIRDSILAVSGRLDRGMGGSAVAELGDQAVNNNNSGGSPATDQATKRSVYLPVIRNNLVPVLDVFDFADPDVSVGRRDATTVPTQALYLMNSPFVFSQARAAAARLLRLPVASRLPVLYRCALGRKPTSREVERAGAFVENCRSEKEAWQAICQAIFACTEFRFVE